MAQIEMAASVDEGGMATMIADIIRGNLEEKPHRVSDFNALDGNVYMRAEDAEVDMTLAFSSGGLVVHGGRHGASKISIATDSATLLDLANITIKWGLPYYLDGVGRSVITKLLTGKLKINGLLTHPIMLTRFTKLMSVK
jgi:hypothetical protein